MSDNIRPSPVLRLRGVLRGHSERTCGQVPAEEEDAEAAGDPRRRKHVRRRMEEQSDGESGHRDAREDRAAEGDGPRAAVDIQLHEDDLVEPRGIVARRKSWIINACCRNAAPPTKEAMNDTRTMPRATRGVRTR